MRTTQKFADELEGKTFRIYRELKSDKDAAEFENKFPILYLYNAQFEKILGEIKSDKPDYNEIYIWHLYNMGYIFKTQKICFAVDISHRRAAELAPYLDFILTTHQHSDHFSKDLFAAMKALGKPIISNFEKNDFTAKTSREYNFGGVKIYASAPIAHNAKLKKFVTTFEIVFSEKDFDDIVFFHCGDACDWRELKRKTTLPCTLIPHLSVGLDIVKAREQTNAVIIYISHILELSHDKNKWRWSVQDAFRNCANPELRHSQTPMWGEKNINQFCSGKAVGNP